MRERSLRLERHGSTKSFCSGADGSKTNLSFSDSFDSFASRDSICPRKKEEPTAASCSEGNVNAIATRMELRLQALEQKKGMYCSSRGLDLDVITAGEEDEETGDDDSFATLDSEYDSDTEESANDRSYSEVPSCPKASILVDLSL